MGLNEDEMRDAVLLVFANKQDLPNAIQLLRSLKSLACTTCATGSGSFNLLAPQLVMACTRVLIGFLTHCRRRRIEMRCQHLLPLGGNREVTLSFHHVCLCFGSAREIATLDSRAQSFVGVGSESFRHQ